MRITGKQFQLQAAFDKAFNLVGKGGNDAYTQGMLLVEDDNLRLVGSDGEQTLVVAMTDIQVQDPENCFVSKVVHDIIKACSEDDVTLDITDDKIIISCAGANWSVHREEGEDDDYPDLDVDLEDAAVVNRDELAEALRVCRVALHSNSLRPLFGFVQVKDGYMQCTDGSKFHRMPLACESELLIPSSALVEIQRQLRAMATEEVIVASLPRLWVFKFDDDILLVSKDTRPFPDLDTRLVQPTESYTDTLTVNKDLIVEAIKRMSLTADPDTRYLELQMEDNSLRLSASDRYDNKSEETINVVWEHPERTIGVNWRYFLDLMSVYPDTEVTIKVGNEEGPRLPYLRFDTTSSGFFGILTLLVNSLDLMLNRPGADGNVSYESQGEISQAPEQEPVVVTTERFQEYVPS